MKGVHHQPVGSEHGLAKLTEDQVRCLLYGSDMELSSRKAAEKYKVSQTCIARIRSGRAWRHV